LLTSAAAVPLIPGSSAALDVPRFLPALPAYAAGAGLILWLLHRFWLSRLSPKPATLADSPIAKLLVAALTALGLLVLCLLVPAAAGSFRSPAAGWTPFPYPPGPSGFARIPLDFLVQSLSEELLFRGIVMGGIGALFLLLASWVTVHPLPGEPPDSARLGAARRRTWLLAGLAANAVQATVFTAVHLANPGVTPLATVNIGLAGFVLGWLYWSQGSLWGAWAWHFLWNFGLAAAGVPVSGVVASAPLLPLGITGARAGLASGGAFGPEASAICTAGLLATLAGFLVAFRRRWTEERR
jgi:membrane protease YdiL (CAAX protease family)